MSSSLIHDGKKSRRKTLNFLITLLKKKERSQKRDQKAKNQGSGKR
jgi:hypothetical protein